MIKSKENIALKNEGALTYSEEATDLAELGITTNLELDRYQLDERGPMQLIRFRIDINTKYHDKETGEGGILKLDGVDIATKTPIKYYSTSKIITGQILKIADKVGVKMQDINGVDWQVLRSPVNLLGFDKINSEVKGHNPYIVLRVSPTKY